MKINRENYETYFIDYLEGNLDELLINDFIAFLQNNPDLKEELSLLETVAVNPENISYRKKEKLYKDKYDVEKEFDQAAIANLEGDISSAEKTKFHAYLSKHPEKQSDFILFGKTKLIADESIVFSNKKKLYRYSAAKIFLLWSGRIAAILILAIAFFTIVNQQNNKIIPENKVAVIDDKSGKEESTNKEESTPEEKIVPIDEKKKDPVKVNKGTPATVIKKTKPKPTQNKSLRESTKGRATHEDIAINRIPVEHLNEIHSIRASIETPQIHVNLDQMYYATAPLSNNPEDERLLADVVLEKTGLNKFQFNKITKAGLSLVSNISNEKFQYQTDKEGKITEYTYDSRLFAFSIPSKNANPE